MKRFLITSALPYANGPIHFGHIAGAYLPADCYARYQRLKKNDVLYICGSDEYGIAITLSAELCKRTPQEHVNIFHKKNYEVFQQLDFSFDHYSRTTCSEHKEVVQEFFLDLYKNGYIEEREEEHLYSEEEQRFLADRYVIGICPKCGFEKARGDECTKCGVSYEAEDLLNPRSKLTGSQLILKRTKHWYLRFDLFKDSLKKWISKKKWKANVLEFTKNYIKDLKPRAITRDLLWGIPIPLKGTEGKVLYVWFDAPIGYISIVKQWATEQGQPDLWKKYWFDENTKLVHFIGKDNIPFHTVFFPSMIMGQDKPYILPDQVPANEFLLLEGRQFSKSDDWYIDLKDFFSKYNSCQIRFYLSNIAPENSDSEFMWKDFQNKCNALLLGKLGNFVNRTLVFYKNFCTKVTASSEDIEDGKKCISEIEEAYENFQLKKATSILMRLCDLGNTYFDKKKPWTLKDPSKKDILEAIISNCLNYVRLIALASYPIIPKTAEKIWDMLGYKKSLSKCSWDEVVKNDIPVEQKIKDPSILFKKIEDKEIQMEIDKLYKKSEEISFSDFNKMQLVVGEILSCEKLGENLLKMQINIKKETRVIVSSLAKYFSPPDLIKKKVIVVANLKPKKIFGVVSHGMILVAEGEKITLPFVNAPVGSPVC